MQLIFPQSAIGYAFGIIALANKANEGSVAEIMTMEFMGRKGSFCDIIREL